MFTEMVEYGCKIEEKLKAIQSEIKSTNNEGKDSETQINDLKKK